MAQFCWCLLKELGYQVHYQNGMICCSDVGVCGHVWLTIQGNEYSKVTVFVPYDVSTDDGWLLARDTSMTN
jgi:hypothetical protein